KRLAQDRNGSCNRGAPGLEYAGVVFGRDYSGRIDKDRLHVAIVVMGKSQLQQTRLSRDGDADLVGEVKSATPLPVLLLQKDLYHRMKLSALSVVEQTIVCYVCAHECLPLRGERALSRLGAAKIAEPMEHGRHLLRGIVPHGIPGLYLFLN